MDRRSRLGEILFNSNEITIEQLKDAIDSQDELKKKLGFILVEKGYASEAAVIKALEYQMGIKAIDLDNYIINKVAVTMISEKLARRTCAIPVDIIDNKLIVAMADPLNILDVENIELESGMKVETFIAIPSQINSAIDKYMSSRNTEIAASEIYSVHPFEELSTTGNTDDDFVSNSPIVKLINSLIQQAVKLDASDIHIEPFDDCIRVRFRIDGDLREILRLPIKTHSAVVTRIKVMAGMNIAEKRLPQDGRIELNLDACTIDMRISNLPTVYGEKIVIRILNRGNFLKSKHELGFSKSNLKLFESLIKVPNGIILIAGPTGSGKTTSLYAILNELSKVEKNIITVEDPVEYKIDGINQLQTNSKIGLTFANGLRSILRQDPDIIMIGEIRDSETAEIAVRAAITGHLVISTLHTNDSPSAVVRLVDMGIKPFLIAASLKGVVSQRLVKRICSNCKNEYQANEYEIKLLNITGPHTLYKGRGCPKCYNTGYSGRIAIHEIMNIDETLIDIIYKGGSINELTVAAVNNGMTSLMDNCRMLVLDGITTIEEYSQIVFKL